ncbi:MAG TPA: glycosyl transferase family 1, partial [Acidimicrobiia bacterium]|nr:glycosyl transferase family 1 [Acidimicrobiia bacterium]
MGKGRIAFVPPRYGDDVVGGAETVLRQAAERLAGRGWEIDILTTCARDHYTWANAYPAGSERHGDLTVFRFPVVHPRES